MRSKLKPSHLAIGVVAVVVAVPLIALTQLGIGDNHGPVIRIKLPETQIHAPPEETDSPVFVSPVQNSPAVSGDPEADAVDSPGVAPAPRLVAPKSAPPAQSPQTAGRAPVSRAQDTAPPVPSAVPRAPAVIQAEREAQRTPAASPPVTASAPRPAPPAPVTRPARDVPALQTVSEPPRAVANRSETERDNDGAVSDTEAAREALRDVRPR